MPGMRSGLDDANPMVVAAFRSALLHQGLIVIAVILVLGLAWVSLREWIPSIKAAAGRADAAAIIEPTGRRFLRIAFGIVWIIDGVLQAQPKMAEGMPSQVIQPAAATSPEWVQHLVNWAGTTWSYHPIQAGAATVWIQIGIGAWLLAAPRGWLSRSAGLVSVGWGLVVWVFGEAFGGIFAPGLTILFGAPGAVLFYCAAGALIALPDRWWRTPELGRSTLAVLGLFFVGMAVLQAWPGRGFWQGTLHGSPGSLTSMVQSMATTPQPHFLASWVSAFASFTAANGLAVNVVAVILLAVIGIGLLSGRPWLLKPTLAVMIVFCLADWVLIEDLGFLGGVGTDPNSMIPILLLAIGGFLAMTRLPATVEAPAEAAPATAEAAPATAEAAPATAEAAPATAAAAPATADGASKRSWRELADPARLAREFGGARLGTIVALWAAVVVLVGAAPMAMAQANPTASTLIAQAIDGDSAPLNYPAAPFTLTDQNGRQVSLASLRGKVVLLTFLDPVCTSDCPLIAQEFRQADQILGTRSRDVELVAVVTNPLYHTVAYTRAFDQQEHLTMQNWLYLTGSDAQLQRVWKNYAVAAQILAAGGMIAHSDVAYVIDASGNTRRELDFDPGPGTQTSKSSFAAELADDAEQVIQS
jgi:cytochrome oxidase Cu insertion factor (SCO1/SenC/PrrC family)